MPHCTNCNYKWNSKEILSLCFSKSGKDCPNCGHRQYISAKTQRFFTLGYLSLIFVPFLFFRIKLSDKDEPML
ncbi:TIGR04104 family putative zinc finger protein [Virgibacillus sp. W0430]|uniref:TIGR04104 family putative zinc finger protein n=1 Tax=Virgibacillus sp. W0430 TaxID=3391580 RepID=UPI003F462FFB